MPNKIQYEVHLRCSCCGTVLINGFWRFVHEETEQMFSALNVPCRCGASTAIQIGHGPKVSSSFQRSVQRQSARRAPELDAQ